MPTKPQHEIGHLPLWDSRYMLSASKRTSHRNETRALNTAIANVLTDERLANFNLRKRLEQQGDDFRVDLADLNPEGFEFSSSGFQRWLENQDRWTTERTASKLEAALRREVKKFRNG